MNRNRMTALAIAYSKGLISWPQIAEETGASYGDLLIALGVNNLQIPKVVPKNRAEQITFFNQILDAAAANLQGKKEMISDQERLNTVRTEMLKARTFNKPFDADENWLASEDTETGAISYLPKELLLEHHRLQRKIRGIK